MKCMTLEETIANLKKNERECKKEGRPRQAADYAATRHMLILLSTGKQKRKPSTYQLKMGKFLKAGKSIQEAHKLTKSKTGG